MSAPDGYVGLFGSAVGGSWIHNLKLNNTTIHDSGVAIGTLGGQMSCTLISGVESANISITDAKNFSGGLIGYSYGGTEIFYSKTQGSLSTADDS